MHQKRPELSAIDFIPQRFSCLLDRWFLQHKIAEKGGIEFDSIMKFNNYDEFIGIWLDAQRPTLNNLYHNLSVVVFFFCRNKSKVCRDDKEWGTSNKREAEEEERSF